MLGFIWLLSGPVIIYFLVMGAVHNIDMNGKKDINNPIVWVIIIAIFIPIAVGLMIFGYYALKGEYDCLPHDSTEV